MGIGNACVLVYDADLGHSADHDLLSGTVFCYLLDGPEFLEHQFTVVLGLDGGIGCRAGSRTTNVESTEGKLCTRLTDGLCCDDSDNFTLLDHPAGREVTAVALCANSLAGFASEDGTYLDLLDGEGVNKVGGVLADLFACLDDKLSGERVENVVD